jgi:hypothetical protein
MNIVTAPATSTSLVYASEGGAAAHLTPALGNATGFANTTVMSFFIKVPIAGWSSYPKPLFAVPTVTYGQNAEQFSCLGVAGMGATNTKIPYFGVTNFTSINLLGTIVSTDTTNGFSFTATKRCKVTACFSAASGAANAFGWSLNSNQLTTSLTSITASNRIAAAIYNTSQQQNCTVEIILAPGDILRPHADVALSASSTYPLMLVAEPEEGQVNQAAIIAQGIAWVTDTQDETTNGGGSSANTLTTRTLNRLDGSIAEVGVTLSANAFTLPIGKYTIEWSCPTYGAVNQSQSQLYNNTDSIITKDGDAWNTGTTGSSRNIGSWTGTITKSTAFLIKHYTEAAIATNGLGAKSADANAVNTATTNIYTRVKITRHA